MKTDVLITGIGPVCALGIGYDWFVESLRESESAIVEIDSFNHDNYPFHTAGIIDDFDVDDYLPCPKNFLDRNTELAYGAFKLALDSANLTAQELEATHSALVWGSAFANIDTMNRFFCDVHKKGPRFAKPILFPHTYANTTISMLNIDYKLTGPHLNFAAGWTSSSQALAAGYDLIQQQKADYVLVGCSEAFSEPLLKYAMTQSWTAGSTGAELACPFDARANGLIPGEAACVVVLESRDHALKRQAPVVAELHAVEMTHSPAGPSAASLSTCINKAMTSAGLSNEMIDAVFSTGCSIPALDSLEAEALSNCFESKPAVTAIASLTGSVFGASGLLNLAAATCAVEHDFVPAIANLQTPATDCELHFVTGHSQDMSCRNILINDLDPSGNYTSILISKGID